MRSAPHAIGIALLACAFAVPFNAAAAVEPWADVALPVKEGLGLWLDASRQPQAWAAHGKPGLVTNTVIDVCYDASGNRRDLAQSSRAAQPKYFAGAHDAVIRFDGKDDYLQRDLSAQEVGEFTIVFASAIRSNTGTFRAILSAAETGKNDYVTGLNVDLGPFASGAFEVLNVEGRGFGGAANLLKAPSLLRKLQVVALTGDAGSVRAYVGGKEQGTRARTSKILRADHLFLGSRFYSNEAAPPFVSGFLDGDIAELLIYDRVLSGDELTRVSEYVAKKHASYKQEIVAAEGEGGFLKSLENPPDVQVFVPGFSVRKLPVDLTNVNNLRYRDDGKLMAVAYDGNIYAVSDTDGDGLEDKAELFWDNRGGQIVSPIGAALTPPGYKLGRGVFVACKGKVSLLLDADGDGRAEKEVIVATGWKPLQHTVDALGLTLGPDGSVYFGLGTTNFTNAYLIDASGKPRYDLKDDHGTIQKVSSDFSKRETICTGIRFPVGMAFNPQGDLFVTDQEGATWLANGNPLDELLHIQPGRHYGFPPRHPKHLPGVIDEPSVFDYAPQHQSTCGLTFDEPVNGGPIFGPAWWRGDAIICGESRGKLYRTHLVKTPAGYVAQNQIFASLTQLTVDACVSPKGDLIVATHSGNPDWGSGPTGKGALYRIHYEKAEQPQPVACWAETASEVRVAFDRPLEPAMLQTLTKDISIEAGGAVSAGDRFEKIRPGYEAVQRQLSQRRRSVPVLGVAVTPDRKTLVLSTARQSEAVRYAVTLPGLGNGSSGNDFPQVNAIDLAYDLCGVQAEWLPERSEDKPWSGWLPHIDLGVSRELTRGSAAHDVLWESLKKPGTLKLRTRFDLWNMLRPAVQEGSKIDYALPPEQVSLRFESGEPIDGMRTSTGNVGASTTATGNETVLRVTPVQGGLVDQVITLATGKAELKLAVSWLTNEDPRPRALPLRRMLMPWANLKQMEANAEIAKADLAELKGGDWVRGRDVFFGLQAGCAKCHRVNGAGSDLGPDLSNLIHRDYESVLRDIRQPSGALNPDYIGSTVRLKNGRTYNGLLRSAGADEFIVRGDADGEKHPFTKEQIDRVVPSALSVMPEGLDKALPAAQLRDLMTFLLTQPLEPAAMERQGAPPPRSRAELDAVLAAAAENERAKDERPLRILLSSGPKDHGPGEHDYPKFQERWSKLLAMADGVKVATCQGFPTQAQFDAADVVVFYSDNPGWSKEKAADLDAYLSRGGGAVYIHYAVDGHDAAPELAERIGLAWGAGAKFRHGALDLKFSKAPHPITAGFEKLGLEDESYWSLRGDPSRVHLLATNAEDGKDQPLIWAREQGKGRVFVSIPGHFTWTFDDTLFRVLLLRGIAWTGGRPAERLTGLASIGARVQ